MCWHQGVPVRNTEQGIAHLLLITTPLRQHISPGTVFNSLLRLCLPLLRHSAYYLCDFCSMMTISRSTASLDSFGKESAADKLNRLSKSYSLTNLNKRKRALSAERTFDKDTRSSRNKFVLFFLRC